MSEQTITKGRITRGWSIEGFRSFWSKVNPELVPLIHEISTSDIVGYWPRPIGVIRGSVPYVGVIEAILRLCPDFSVTAAEYVRSEDLHFIRWVATGTGRDGRFEINGCDRVRTTPEGWVCENYIFSDHPFFADVAAYLRDKTDRRS
jgi:hypothetical protein